ncbi:inactive protein kinase SELMODRAFT_444075-like [Diospyros lotus]|uniref:inactive protein kinase SELMODRAFT_444075-like n=1 Tax=Diospyros lotus TaxID=55363 RepID=UPI002257A676|nr:inactive protein kinase SELMODRAFT_444075-like [Diospyros lotus]XP_052189782.1 inactive protein kinase SELMODRAFT_444075-like [Diospyros lotus]
MNRLAAEGKVIVAVKAEKVISKTALAWALTHVVRPGDCITLLAVLSARKTGRRRSFWSLPRLTGDCGTVGSEKLPERISQISKSFSQMVLQLQSQIEVRVQIKVVPGTPSGGVAAEAKRNAASWVILHKKLKQEQKHCLEELHCNIVVMKGSQPKVLRLNLECSDELQTPFFSAASSPGLDVEKFQQHRVKHSTPVSSPEEPSTSYTRTTRENSLSSPDTVASLFLVYEQNPLFEIPKKGNYSPSNRRNDSTDLLRGLDKDGDSTRLQSAITNNHKSVFWIPQNHTANVKVPARRNYRNTRTTNFPPTRSLVDVQFNQEMIGPNRAQDRDYVFNSTIRQAVSLGRTSSIPPPLCSICQHKAPAFGKPPRQFDYKELKEATDGFSDTNFLAEGGFGIVHRGVLRDGQVVAVKQLKFAGSQGDADFCREVRVLSCAQHRNVVLLVGFCIEDKNRILVYEYICNGSLDFHLHGNKRTPLDWHSRQKIAIGTARGLRYLHEDCRVGCIVHRDMRPSNILLTHDYEPLVADFGLARLHTEWDACDEQVVGTSGYLAPEYFRGGKITEKVDIYAFGLVLLELITGQKASNLHCDKGRHILAENSYLLPTQESGFILGKNYQLIGSCLAADRLQNLPHELQVISHAAFLCLQQNPELRPPMPKVLRILEGGYGAIPLGLDLNSLGSRSGHMRDLRLNTDLESARHARTLSH